jgi:hypothetical protein
MQHFLWLSQMEEFRIVAFCSERFKNLGEQVLAARIYF